MLVGNPEIKIDISDLEFMVLNQTSTTATVSIKGEQRGSVGGIADIKEIDEEFRMIKEDGKWKWCDEI
jgi:hypothetical protein